VAKFDAVLAGEEAANAVVAVFDGGDAGPEGGPGTHFAEVMGAFDDAPIVDEPAEEGEVPGGGVSFEETGLGTIDGQDDCWGRHGSIVPFGAGLFFVIRVSGVLRNMSDKPAMRLSLLLILGAVGAFSQTVPNIKDTALCTNTPNGKPRLTPGRTGSNLDMKRIVLNAPGAVCNDGTPAYMYVRAARAGAAEPDGPSANRWVIHFEGGGSCSSYEGCLERWCGVGFYTAHQMSTTYEDDAISRGGLLERNSTNRLADRNTVMVNYCSSDSWQGQKSDAVLRSETDATKAYTVHYRGATIAAAAIDALLAGVAGMPKLSDATDVLISGDSAGAAAVRTHLDRIAARLRAVNPNVRVRGNMEATFYPDLNGKQGFPAGDPMDPPFVSKTAAFEKESALLNNQLDDSCVAAHPGAKYLCSESGFVELNHITTPFFQIQDMADPGMYENYVDAGAPFTQAQVSQYLHDQLTALGNLRNTAVEKAAISFTPGAAGRLCGVHVMWGDTDGFLGRKIRTGPGATAYSYYELLWNWMTGATPTTVLAPKPPLTPEMPVFDTICDAKAPTAAPGPAIATISSASYALGGAVAPESIVATFGTGLANATATATTNPWPTTLGGVQVTVTDAKGTARLAPLYFVSPGQLLYLVPAGTAAGTAQVAIGGQRSTVEVAVTAPAIYTAAQNGKGVAAGTFLKVSARGVRTEDLLFDPLTKAAKAVPVAAGDQVYLILYGTGMRGGAATATVGEVAVPVAGPVAQGQYQGLDQINLGPLPLRIGPGQKQIVIRQEDGIANIATVTFRVE
jgi:uncharacterized protein (TIGR03437 family)